MSIETLDDIVEDLLNKLGIYGAHTENEERPCRCCVESDLKHRIRKAVAVEEKLYVSELDETLDEKPVVAERYADNGAHSHYELIDPRTGVVLWSERNKQLPDNIREKFKKYTAGMRDLPPEFVQIINDNFWDLL